ncbi:MAG: phosphoenolpyruvate carboxykinase (ATP) [Bacteriovoracaceae bacterium]|nr:phosphoenolpyruvate carboxykinase (ATP) [Bacteriovoracaceae bacterium]
MSSFESKLQFLNQYNFDSPQFCYHLNLNYYGLKVRFESDDLNFIEAIKAYHPSSWVSQEDGDVTLRFISYSVAFERSFFEEISPEFNVFKSNNHLCCIQRDFIGWTQNGNVFTFVTDLTIDDGYFNCMRWAIPSLLIKSQAMVVHSSSVVDDEGACFVFLGQSGAGKTTTVSNFKNRIVLGDDMNIFTTHHSKSLVQSGAIGGQIVFPEFDKKFALKGMFWLRKNEKLSLRKLSLEDARLKMLGSLANIFFGFESEDFTNQVMNNIDNLIQSVPMFELSLMKGDDFWPLIQKI